MTTDVVISFDTTGSMSPCIAEVRRRVQETLDQLFSTIPDLQVGMISHGDYCDGKNSIDLLDLTDERERLIEFVRTTPNTHGGDFEEMYEYVLRVAATQFDWRSGNKILIMIGDATPHPVGYRYSGRDPVDHSIITVSNNISWQMETERLSNLGISIYSVQALGRRQSDYFYDEIAFRTNGRKLNLNQFADAVETIIAISYHGAGGEEAVESYKEVLTANFKMNRNLANMFHRLGATRVIVEESTSGLTPVLPYRFQILHVDYPTDIRSFVNENGATFKKGRGFYQFTKKETIQEYKEVVLRHKASGDMFTGPEARNYIGLPFGERGDIRPNIFGEYDVFVQSTSVNRKLLPGTLFLYENE